MQTLRRQSRQGADLAHPRAARSFTAKTRRRSPIATVSLTFSACRSSGVPYFQSADPTVKRKSGFLMPMYSQSDTLGTTVTVPYYFALSDHFDFTFAPMYTSEAGTSSGRAIGAIAWRAAAIASISPACWTTAHSKSRLDGDFRGSIVTQGKFALNPYWSWGWDAIAESDDTFRRFYNLDSKLKTDRISQLYLEGLHDRNYASMRFYETGTLLRTQDPLADATVYPIIDYDYIFNNPIVGGELSFNSNIMALANADGTDSNRLIMQTAVAAADDRPHRPGLHALRPAPRRRLRRERIRRSGDRIFEFERRAGARHRRRRRGVSLSVHRHDRQRRPCLRADRPGHRQAGLGRRRSVGDPERGCEEPRLRRHHPVRHRQVLRLRPHRDRHPRQCRRSLHRATAVRRLCPRGVRRKLSARRPEQLR